MKKFVAQEGNEFFKVLIWLIVIFVAFMFIVGLFYASLPILIISFVVTISMIILVKHIKKFGLYIENDELCFKRFFKKRCKIEDIAGLLIIKSQIENRYYESYIQNRNGDFEYSIIYLKEVLPEFANYARGNHNFMFIYKEYAYFYTVYDEEIIEIFKRRNVPILTCV